MLLLNTNISVFGLIAILAEVVAAVAPVAANVVDSLPSFLTKATIDTNETTNRAVPRRVITIFEVLDFVF